MKYDEPDDIWEGITPCPTHPVDMADNCETCEAEIAACGARIEQMSAEAKDRVQGIMSQGGPAMPEQLIMQARLEVLIDSLLQDPRQRLRYEGEVGRRIMLSVKATQTAMKQPTLHVAKNLSGVTPIRGNGQPRR